MNNVFRLLLILLTAAGAVQAAPNIEHKKVRLQSLNKTTAQTATLEMDIGQTIRLGQLYVRPQACRTNPATEEPESAAFLQVWTLREPEQEGAEAKSEWVFSGWMFASSPGLSSMDHPVFDLWVLDCGKDAAAASVISTAPEDSAEKDSKEMVETEEDGQLGVLEEESEEDAPVVKLDGEELSVPDQNHNSDEAPAAAQEQFEEYEDETDPIVHLE